MKIPGLSRIRRTDNEPELQDPGFGTKMTSIGDRLINKDGSYNIVREGQQVWTAYQSLVEMSWSTFFLSGILYYVGINLLFGFGFILIGVDKLSGVTPAGFISDLSSAFFFSVQTFTTVGYGAVNPQGVAANLLASADALVGLISTALLTGLFFARFSKAKAQLIFSKDALIAPYRGTDQMSFQFRIANLRKSRVINLRCSVILSWVETTPSGYSSRRFFNLPLERNEVNLLPLNWTVVHLIKDDSPIKGWEPRDFTNNQAEVIIFIEGYDESFGQKIHVSSSYTCREIRWNAKFLPMYYPRNGKTVLDLDAIHQFEFMEDSSTAK
ncbi:MAG: ion channel [Bacteroidota bacterium]